MADRRHAHAGPETHDHTTHRGVEYRPFTHIPHASGEPDSAPFPFREWTCPVAEGAQRVVEEHAFRISQDGLKGALSGRLDPVTADRELVIVGSSPAMIEVYHRMCKMAMAGDSHILVRGQTGTGKENAARAFHLLRLTRQSLRPGRNEVSRFTSFNSAGLSDELAMSELFGYVPGAFTNALKDGAKGLISRGPHQHDTLFIDELGEMKLRTQAAMLRALQEREFLRVGGTEPIRFRTFVIAATSLWFEQALPAGSFRSELYYRLAQFTLQLPDLRDRGHDVVLVAHYLLGRNQRALDLQPHLRFHEGALRKLVHRLRWYGNVRSLGNCLNEALVRMDLTRENLIREHHISFDMDIPDSPEWRSDSRQTVRDLITFLAHLRYEGSDGYLADFDFLLKARCLLEITREIGKEKAIRLLWKNPQTNFKSWCSTWRDTYAKVLDRLPEFAELPAVLGLADIQPELWRSLVEGGQRKRGAHALREGAPHAGANGDHRDAFRSARLPPAGAGEPTLPVVPRDTPIDPRGAAGAAG